LPRELWFTSAMTYHSPAAWTDPGQSTELQQQNRNIKNNWILVSILKYTSILLVHYWWHIPVYFNTQDHSCLSNTWLNISHAQLHHNRTRTSNVSENQAKNEDLFKPLQLKKIFSVPLFVLWKYWCHFNMKGKSVTEISHALMVLMALKQNKYLSV